MPQLLPTTLSTLEIAILAVTALVAGCARGFSGFGGALIFVPIASAVVGPQLAVPLLLPVDFALTPGLLPRAWQFADRRNVFVMSIGGLAGVPAGAYLLLHLDPTIIRWAIPIMVAMMLALLVSGWRFHGRPHSALTVGVGLTSGLFAGAAQVGGPPVVAYWLGGPMSPKMVRANIVLYFAIVGLLSLATYLVAGLLNWETLRLSLLVGPTFAIGLFAGGRIFHRASETTFRGACYALIACASILGLPVMDGILR